MLISLIVELLVPVVIFVVYFATKQHSTDDVTNNHEQKSKSKQPAYKNIIFILADDLGFLLFDLSIPALYLVEINYLKSNDQINRLVRFGI